jgi:tripartite-type tricarboxylate transporter receptor subunit TctC
MAAVSGIVVSGALAVSAAPAAADFYAGKTVSLIVSSDAGGGYDTYTRLLAPYMRKHIPGNPTVIVQNMPGGGGLRLAQHLYSVADKDGTKIGNVRASNALDSILGVRGADIDPTRFEWVGDMSSDVDVCVFWHTSGIRTLEDLRARETIIGATGKGGQNYSFPSAMNYALGTKMKIILGYKGLGDRVLAMERGEVQGNCGINGSTLLSLQADLVKQGKLVPIVQSGGKAHKGMPNVPLTQTFARTDRERRILMTIFSQMDIARTYALPPGTPKDRVAIIRKAFMAAMEEPGLLADAKKMGLELDPKSGEEVQKIIAEMADLSPELKKEVRSAIGQ